MTYKFLFLLVFIIFSSFLQAQDTIIGWTFPTGINHPYADIGNTRNKEVMFVEAVTTDETPFGTISFSEDGFLTKSASISGWNTSKGQKAWKFSVDATDYSQMKFFCKIASDSLHPGPRDFFIQYRLGCCSPEWHDIPPGYSIKLGNGWTTVENIPIPPDAANMAGLEIRLLLNSDSSAANELTLPDGVSKVDEIYVTGTKIGGVESSKTINNISFFPNPAREQITILCKENSFSYTVSDLNGHCLLSGSSINQTTPVALDGLAEGFYIFSVFTGKRTETRLLQVLK